jgi:REP element-mobilizing transposase RayT
MYTHIVFSTKHREPHLIDRDLAQQVHAYLAGTCENLESTALLVGGASDHVHILCRLSPKITVMDLLRELKRESSKWVKQTFPSLRRFYWQSGYGAFSISPSHVEDLKRYIQRQVEHHRKETFQEELRRFFKKYGIEFDERYVWD